MKQIYILTFFFLLISITFLNAQTLDVDFTGACGNALFITETQTVAQSFTSGLSGALTKVNVGISVDNNALSSVTGVANIYSGDCNGTLLESQAFSFQINTSLALREISFSNPPIVSSGQTYTLELVEDSGQNVTIRWHFENSFNCGGEYLGGTANETRCSVYPGDAYIQTFVSSALSNTEINLINKTIKIFPNSSIDFIQIQGLTKTEKYRIYNILGLSVYNGLIADNDKINILNLTNGIYFLKFENGNTIKFIKDSVC